MGWRLYARRATTGEWLDTDVQLGLTMTWALSDPGEASGVLPAQYDIEAADGLPMWDERGTLIYAEEDGNLRWSGLLDFVRPGKAGVELDFKGITSAFDLIGFEGRIREWQADPFDVVEQLLTNAQSQPSANLGVNVVRHGRPPTFAGDEQPPDRPKKPKRKKGQSKQAYDDGPKFLWEKAVDDWERLYGDREPYSLAWWEAQYVGAELRELAQEIPFEWFERVTWANAITLEPQHDLILTPKASRRRDDIAFTEGDNVLEVIDPATNLDRYGNSIVVLGAGDGSAMKVGRYARRDNRVRTTRYFTAKHVKHHKRLVAKAQEQYGRSQQRASLGGLRVKADSLSTVLVGDEVRITTRLFTGWRRVTGITRDTLNGPGTLSFAATAGGG